MRSIKVKHRAGLRQNDPTCAVAPFIERQRTRAQGDWAQELPVVFRWFCVVIVVLGMGHDKRSSAAEALQLSTVEASRAEYERVVRPFLKQHCLECHQSQHAEGELDLQALDPDMKASSSGARWAMVVEKLSLAEMPPRDRPRPSITEQAAMLRWAHAEAKRANKHFARRAAYANGNQVPHELLFDPQRIAHFDVEPRIRRLSPDIYAQFLKEHAKRPGANQAFSPEGRTTFKDMGAPKIDEPITATLLQNALVVVESQTDFRIEDGKFKGNVARELQPLLQPDIAASDTQLEQAIVYQFNTMLRRTPSDDEKSRFVALMKRNITAAGPLLGARYTLAAVLLLPEAVFRLEIGDPRPDEKGRVRLAPREIAFAVSYSLTDRRPDAALLTAAAKGELDTDAGVAQQVGRLLEDAKIEKTSVARFFREYFGYDKAIDVFKDPDNGGYIAAHLGHDPRVLIEDTDRLVQFIVERDQQVLRELLTTNQTFVAYKTAAASKKQRAEARAQFEAEKAKNPEKYQNKTFKPPGRDIFLSYDLNDFPDEQPVALPGEQRLGILMQPAWLVAHSTTFDNHVIHRGKWIRERLLGGVVPDVPITVDAQLPIAPEKTLRERMAVTQQEYCWKCHQLMNDLGYPLELFDHFGRGRITEKVLDIEATAQHVDKKGKPLGNVTREVSLDTRGLIEHVSDTSLAGPVRSPAELVRKLARSEHVEQVFVRHAFRFWLGRNETPGDAASLQAVHRAYRQHDGSLKAMLTTLLSSESFLYRVPR